MVNNVINIKYDSASRYCIIECEGENWEQARILLNELSTESLQSSNFIKIPWYSFIAHLNEINYIATRYKLKVNISEETKGLIQTAIQKKNRFNELEKISIKDTVQIEQELIIKGFTRKLKPYQLRNVAQLLRLDSGATFSVPGAGKTSEAIAYFILKRSTQPLLVICPKVAFPAWEEQFDDCFESNEFKITRLTGGATNIESLLKNSSDIYLLTYQQFIKVVPQISRFLHLNESFVFLDESHRVKGGNNSETGRQIQQISHLPISKLIMSGTPMPNTPSDLVTQFKFLFPEIEADENSVVDQIQTIYVRTTKDELGLKKPKRVLMEVPFNEVQKNLYDLSRSEEFRRANSLNRHDKAFLRSLGRSYMRLLQIVSNPALLLKNSFNYPDALREAIEFGDSSKIQYTIKKARQLAMQGQKVLIWSSFVENVELISKKLSDLGADFLHGGVEAGSELEENTRENKVKRFHDDPNAMVLVANPAACSEGISLHKICHHAIYVDRSYNAAQFLQSMDRIHRLGLDPSIETTIEILYTPDSIDENIERRLDAKIKRMSDVLNDPSLHIEAEQIDLDDFEFNHFTMDDADDYLNHLKGN